MNLLTETYLEPQLGGAYSHGHTPVDGIGSVVAMNVGGLSFPIYDHRGSVVRMTNANGSATDTFEYNAWGQMLRGSASYRFQYQSNWMTPDVQAGRFSLSPTRIYDATLGRFLQRDPKDGSAGGYTYCSNNPVTRVDANGTNDEGPEEYLSKVRPVAPSVVIRDYKGDATAYNIIEELDDKRLARGMTDETKFYWLRKKDDGTFEVLGLVSPEDLAAAKDRIKDRIEVRKAAEEMLRQAKEKLKKREQQSLPELPPQVPVELGQDVIKRITMDETPRIPPKWTVTSEELEAWDKAQRAGKDNSVRDADTYTHPRDKSQRIYGVNIVTPKCVVSNYEFVPETGNKVATPTNVSIFVEYVTGFAHYGNFEFGKFVVGHEAKHANVIRGILASPDFKNAFWEAVKKEDPAGNNKGHLFNLPPELRDRPNRAEVKDTMSKFLSEVLIKMLIDRSKTLNDRIDAEDVPKRDEWLDLLFREGAIK